MKQLTPWFGHDRTPEEQWRGLELINWQGKFVLDLGCAEGHITKRALEFGARAAWGVEHREDYVKAARRLAPEATFACADLNEWPESMPPKTSFDIVLMLAILHKLQRPLKQLARFAAMCGDVAVIRLPPHTGPVICDPRTGNVPMDTRPVMLGAGFRLEAEHYNGPRGEYMAYWRRMNQERA